MVHRTGIAGGSLGQFRPGNDARWRRVALLQMRPLLFPPTVCRSAGKSRRPFATAARSVPGKSIFDHDPMR